MASTTEIANMALSHLGVGKEIANLDTEKSQEASACNRFYVMARDMTLRSFNWPFARKVATLALIANNPTDEWLYSYQQPSDCIAIRRILSGIRNETRTSRVPYRLADSNTGAIIYSDRQNAVLEYTSKETDPSKYAADFALALSLLLSSLIAPRVTGGDPFKLGDKAQARYEAMISRAMADAVNEEQMDEEPISDFISERN